MALPLWTYAKRLFVFVLFPLLLTCVLNAYSHEVMTPVQISQCTASSSLMAYLLFTWVLHPLRMRWHTDTRFHCAPPRKTDYLTMIGFFVCLFWFRHVGVHLVPGYPSYKLCTRAQCEEWCPHEYNESRDAAYEALRTNLLADHLSAEQGCRNASKKWQDSSLGCQFEQERLKKTDLKTKHAYTKCLQNLTVCLNQTSTCDREEHAEPSRDESKARNESKEHRRTSTTDAPSAWQQVWEACVFVGFALAALSWCCCAGPKNKSANPPVKRVQPSSSQPAQVQQAQHVQAPPAQVQQAQHVQAPPAQVQQHVANVALASVPPPAAGLPTGGVPARELSDLLKPFVSDQQFSLTLSAANSAGYNKEMWDTCMKSNVWTAYVERNQASLQQIQALKVHIQGKGRPAFVALLVSTSAQLYRLLIEDGASVTKNATPQVKRDKARDHFLTGH